MVVKERIVAQPEDSINSSEKLSSGDVPSSESSPSSKPTSGSGSTPKRNTPVLILYRRLYCLQSILRKTTPRISRSSDRLLACIAYPSRFVGHVTNNPSFLKMASVIGDYRTLSRVVTTPATIESALDTFLDNDNPDLIDRIGDYLQAVSGVIYQVFEDLAYLGDNGVLKFSAKRRADFWVWSSIAWGVDIVICLLRAPYYYFVLDKPVNVRSLVTNLAWAPLCYHWSTYAGVFDNGVVGALGSLACWPTLISQWSQPL